MKVTELLELTSDLALGEYNMTALERAVYLRYLNVANKQFYVIGANGLQTLTKKSDVFLNAATQSFLLPNDIFCIRSVKNGASNVLSKCDVDKENNVPANRYLVLGNSIYCNLAGSNFLTKTDPSDGVVKPYLTIFYAPISKNLVEDVVDIATEIDEPVYPPEYHHYLAFGALYYFYFSSRVFLEKIAVIRDEWYSGKAQLALYKNYSL